MKATVKCALAAGAALLSSAASAQTLPDLVVNVERSQILSLSCNAGEPLAVIRVAIDNIGDGPASRSTSVGLPAIAGVAAEHAPYTYEQVDSRNNIDPGEISTEVVIIGDDMVKAGRIGVTVGGGGRAADVVTTARSLTEQRRLPIGLRRQIQTRLKAAGYYTDTIDGVFGSRSETAIRAFQRARGDSQTGVLTIAQIDDLLRGGPSRASFLSSGGQQRVRFIVLVDPTNLINESDESNNMWITPVQTIDGC